MGDEEPEEAPKSDSVLKTRIIEIRFTTRPWTTKR